MSTVPLRRADRVAAILERLSADRTLGVAELAKYFGVSRSTLRRDLQALQEQRLLTRTHGGARASDVAYELPIRYRDTHHRDQKRHIAAAAVSRIPQGAFAVGLTGGTTTSEVARLLVERTDLTVVTNCESHLRFDVPRDPHAYKSTRTSRIPDFRRFWLRPEILHTTWVLPQDPRCASRVARDLTKFAFAQLNLV